MRNRRPRPRTPVPERRGRRTRPAGASRDEVVADRGANRRNRLAATLGERHGEPAADALRVDRHPSDGVVAAADLDGPVLRVTGERERRDTGVSPAVSPVDASQASGSKPAAIHPSPNSGSAGSASVTRYQPSSSVGIGPMTTWSSAPSGSRPATTLLVSPGRCRTRSPSIVVATTSLAMNSGTAAKSGVEDGEGLGAAVGGADGEGVGEAVRVGVGEGSGWRTQPPSTRATRIGTARLGLPTRARVAAQRSSRGTSEASRSAISRAFVVP